MTPVCHGTTLICYCRKAAVQHAAWSRWQPGRNRKWGLDGREKSEGGGEESVAYVGGCGGRGGWRESKIIQVMCKSVFVVAGAGGGEAHGRVSWRLNVVLVKRSDT